MHVALVYNLRKYSLILKILIHKPCFSKVYSISEFRDIESKLYNVSSNIFPFKCNLNQKEQCRMCDTAPIYEDNLPLAKLCATHHYCKKFYMKMWW